MLKFVSIRPEVSQTIAAVEISVIEAGEESPGFIGQGAR